MKKVLNVTGIVLGCLLLAWILAMLLVPGVFLYIPARVAGGDIHNRLSDYPYTDVTVPDNWQTVEYDGIRLMLPDDMVCETRESTMETPPLIYTRETNGIRESITIKPAEETEPFAMTDENDGSLAHYCETMGIPMITSDTAYVRHSLSLDFGNYPFRNQRDSWWFLQFAVSQRVLTKSSASSVYWSESGDTAHLIEETTPNGALCSWTDTVLMQGSQRTILLHFTEESDCARILSTITAS